MRKYTNRDCHTNKQTQTTYGTNAKQKYFSVLYGGRLGRSRQAGAQALGRVGQSNKINLAGRQHRLLF